MNNKRGNEASGMMRDDFLIFLLAGFMFCFRSCPAAPVNSRHTARSPTIGPLSPPAGATTTPRTASPCASATQAPRAPRAL
mgnify:CR=1 FL=1